jgi:hypothetical protein
MEICHQSKLIKHYFIIEFVQDFKYKWLHVHCTLWYFGKVAETLCGTMKDNLRWLVMDHWIWLKSPKINYKWLSQ